MSEGNLFDQNTNEGQEQGNQQPSFSIPTEVEDFVGNGKKYNSVEDALRSVPHAQKHIQTLEQELAQMKDELYKRKTTEELLDEIKSGFLPENTSQAVDFDHDKLVQLVDQTLTMKEKQKVAQSNAVAVASKFTDQFGQKAEEVYNTIAKENGLTVQQLNNLASNSPNVVLKLAGLAKTSGIPAKTNSSINTEALNTNQQPQELSARVPKGASTRDLTNAWKIAGEKVKQKLSTS